MSDCKYVADVVELMIVTGIYYIVCLVIIGTIVKWITK